MITLRSLIQFVKIPVAVFVAIFLGTALLVTGDSYAEDAVCVFVSQQGNAWVIRKDSAVKVSLKIGDALYEGDKVHVLRGNSVQLAFDKAAKNVLHVEGETMLKIADQAPKNIELEKGKVYALLHDKATARQFRLYTPTAVAAVRGTEYQAMVTNQQSQFSTYTGTVRIAGRDQAGRETSDFVLVKAGEKTDVKAPGQAPSAPQKLSMQEMTQIQGVRSSVDMTKDTIMQRGLNTLFEAEEAATEGSIIKTDASKKKDEPKPKDGTGQIFI